MQGQAGGLGKGKRYSGIRGKLAAARAAAARAAEEQKLEAAIAKSVAGQSVRNKSKHATPEEAAIEQLRIAKGVKAVMAVNAAARKAANAKSVVHREDKFLSREKGWLGWLP